MGDQPSERRLAAILAADVAGYTRLMNQDEAGTINAWQAARAEVIDPLVAEYGGRIVKHTGDGFLAEFATATDAVDCAVRMQNDLAEGGRDVPEARRMQFRMGINLGEITADADDIHGDGVNIAARLEGLAEPGGILVSASVYDQVRKKVDHEFDDMGTRRVKNISEPVRHYRVRLDGTEPLPHAARHRRGFGRRTTWLLLIILAAGLGVAVWRAAAPPERAPGGPPSLAVLPFNAIDGSAVQKSFGAGLTEDLITSLSSIPGIRVLAGSGGGGRSKAQYFIEGSVRGSGKIRITAQLIDAKTGFHLWGGRYDRVLSDPLEQQAEVSAKIVATLDEKLAAIQDARRGGEEEGGGMLLAGLEFIGRVAEEAIALLGTVIGWFMS
ncbi:MAG: adenylate/guanylate cyclase domain-containing protein [Rhodospirillales bacterium]|nr:adenylate/guanylate cyclase domain-containing protein [Rhodospirillales bacterium]MDP6644277.1 adenylate/guanylate cyclase domain-containing protein [Rhodospirillales bacterium]